MRRLAPIALLVALCPSTAAGAAERWARPVPGGVARAFSYGADPFAARQHRGVDLAARRGSAVRAACAGRIVFAGRVAGESGVVSVRCGRWRVSYLGVEAIAVRAGAFVGASGRLGVAAGGTTGHRGLHVGVRREGERFGYVDPAHFLGEPEPPPPPLAPAARRGPPLLPRPVPMPPRPARAAVPAAGPVAPWPVWAGLALVLAGAAGSGYARRSGPRLRRQQPCPVSSTSSSWPTTQNAP